MLSDDLIGQGNLAEALTELQNAIRKNPEQSKYRIFLFQLLAINGDWERALTQLNVLGEMDAGTLAMVQTYREAIKCEAFRKEVFLGNRTPLVFGEPQRWVALLLEAVKLSAQGKFIEADEMRAQAFEQAPTTKGAITSANAPAEPFEWIADADSRLGPVFEAIINGQYYWVPIDSISVLTVTPPEDLRDLVWLPVHFTWTNGGDTVGLIPTRYPGSEINEDNMVRLSRKTLWDEVAENQFFGVGQRLLTTDQNDYSFMDTREISLNPVEESSE